ncbi:MAG: pilus assembly PilX family protein [Gammaproteobacteria bacterium]
MDKYIKSKKRQRGAAALFVALMILIGVTLISIFAAQVGVQDQRISGNEYRAREAFFTAEAGLEQVLAFIRENPSLYDESPSLAKGWRPCSGSVAIPCGNGTVNKYDWAYDSVIASTTIDSLNPTYTTSLSNGAPFSAYLTLDPGVKIAALSIGGTLDGTGEAAVRNGGSIINLITTGPIPPITAPLVELNGNFTIVANPNNEVGNGVPISIWSGDPFVPPGGGGSYQTCHNGEYRDDNDVVCNTKSETDDWSKCLCKKAISSKATGESYDIVDESPEFPADPFAYVFNGLSLDTIRGYATEDGTLLADCSDAALAAANADITSGATEHNFILVEGACSIKISPVGSRAEPVILISLGQMTLNGGGGIHVWGVFFDYSGADTKLNGKVYVHGVLISQKKIDVASGGTYDQIYDQQLFENLTSEDENTELTKCEGCWFDDL